MFGFFFTSEGSCEGSIVYEGLRFITSDDSRET